MFLKIHQILLLKLVNFIVGKFHFNKANQKILDFCMKDTFLIILNL